MGIEFLIAGIDSPVSMLSFITDVPLMRIKSQGMVPWDGISITSPGTSSELLTSLAWTPFGPSLKTLTGQLYCACLWIFFKFEIVSQIAITRETIDRKRRQDAK